jgi:PAS domain S-box-containing protein
MSDKPTVGGAALGQHAVSFEGLLEAAPDAMVGVDQGGVIRFVNRQTELLFGYDRGELVGWLIEMLVPESFRAVHQVQRDGYFAAPKTREMGTDLELRGQRRDGTEFPVDVSLSFIETVDGLLVTAAIRDITERIKADQELQQMAAIIANSDNAIIGKTLDGIVTSWNPAAERMLGYSRQEIVGKSIDLLIPGDRTGEMNTIMARIKAGQHVEHLETTRVRKDGTAFPVSVTVSPIRDRHGVIVGASTIARDVTEARQAFESARSMIESSLDSLVAISPDGMITDVNEATVKVTGIPRGELIGTSVSDYVTEPDKANDGYQLVFDQGSVTDYPLTLRHRDGTLTEVLFNASVYRDAADNVLGVFAAARDVTERNRALAEIAHQAKELERLTDLERAHSMIESSLDSLVAISPDGMITDVNEATVKVTGIPRGELIGTAFSECFTEPGKANAIYQLVFEQGMAVDYPLTMRHRDGTLTEVLYNASVYRDAGGKVLGVFAAARDVTEQKHAAETARSLAVAEDLVRTVMASASIGIALADLDGSFQVVNRSLCDLLGYDEAWFLAHQVRDIVHPDDAEEALRARARVIAGTSNMGASKLRLVRADGATVWVRRVSVLLPGGDGQPNLVMVHVEDITAEHEAQEALTYQAFHDPLTGLHNRAWVLDILAVDLRAAKRLGHSVGALFVDLDNFKVVNDSLGHAAGDEVLATVADRIVAGLRPGDRVGRFGGDEFVIVVQDLQDVLEVERCAERVSAVSAGVIP